MPGRGGGERGGGLRPRGSSSAPSPCLVVSGGRRAEGGPATPTAERSLRGDGVSAGSWSIGTCLTRGAHIGVCSWLWEMLIPLVQTLVLSTCPSPESLWRSALPGQSASDRAEGQAPLSCSCQHFSVSFFPITAVPAPSVPLPPHRCTHLCPHLSHPPHLCSPRPISVPSLSPFPSLCLSVCPSPLSLPLPPPSVCASLFPPPFLSPLPHLSPQSPTPCWLEPVSIATTAVVEAGTLLTHGEVFLAPQILFYFILGVDFYF